ncbi:MAG: cytochrome C [Bacteroidetes bacterium]|nr:MAG: cytochrome C [Bacteroidota bacterium]
MKKILLYSLTILTLFIFSALSYVKLALPDVGSAPDINVEKTATNIARGKYLANSVAVCMDCHATRDWSLFSGPPIPGTEGKGGERFDQTMGFPGVYYSRNLTPYGLGDWTDGEIFRAITTGVSKNGDPLFPVMPHPNYGRADKNDINDIIAYLRSLPQIESDNIPSDSDFPMNFIVNTIPQSASFISKPDKANKVTYGEYLVNMAACADCHTPFEKGQYDESKRLAGGRSFILPWATLTTPNLTPDVKTGLGAWTEEAFVQKFKAYQDPTYVPLKIKKGDFMTLMPWQMYGTMEEEDLKAIYSYLQSLEPINHPIDRFILNDQP